MSPDYKPVPVATAKAIAEKFDKSIVIIFAHDPAHGHLHTTTYGVGAQNKAWAAQGAEIATKALGGIVEAATDFEDYRLTQARKLLVALASAVDLLTNYDTISVDEHRGRYAALQLTIKEAEGFLGSGH